MEVPHKGVMQLVPTDLEGHFRTINGLCPEVEKSSDGIDRY